jgi:hypothetical protein
MVSLCKYTMMCSDSPPGKKSCRMLSGYERFQKVPISGNGNKMNPFINHSPCIAYVVSRYIYMYNYMYIYNVSALYAQWNWLKSPQNGEGKSTTGIPCIASCPPALQKHLHPSVKETRPSRTKGGVEDRQMEAIGKVIDLGRRRKSWRRKVAGTGGYQYPILVMHQCMLYKYTLPNTVGVRGKHGFYRVQPDFALFTADCSWLLF